MNAKTLIPAAAAPALMYAAAAYFFRYTFLRADKPDPWAENPHFKVLRDRAFFEQPGRQLLELTSRDGLRLRAWFYDQGSDVTVMLCHGYRGGPEELSGIAAHLYREGFNVLLPYHRAHGPSEGSYFTMGVREKLDAADWVKKLAALKPEGKIVLFGWSMGANTVMGAVGEALPENVVCAAADCGYESLKDQLLFSCRQVMPRLPAKRAFLALLDLYCRGVRGFSIAEERRGALACTRVPMLFIHGTDDDIVPFENLARCCGPCASEKRSAVYDGAVHAGSCGSDPERYFSELDGFIRDHIK